MVAINIRLYASPLLVLFSSTQLSAQTVVQGSRMAEQFRQTTLATNLNDPWEITYGPDGYLWITEAKGYKVYRMNPDNGTRTTVLDISQNSTFLPTADRGFNLQFDITKKFQGGCAGLALHPKFMDAVNPKNYVYLSYGHTNNSGAVFTSRIVRFVYNAGTNKLENPVSLCDTVPGSSDHNSQRMIIAAVGGVPYLFYACGDMGAGQFENLNRAIKSQHTASYEGKILRFNLEGDGDGGTLDKWIPNDNPFNGGAQSAVWCTGIRNNQGFAYVNGVLYGSSHGPYSDDEINIIESGKNYGHPRVIGYSGDGNYNNSKAGSPSGSLPLITSESANAASIGASYRDPIFSGYAASQGDVHNMYLNNPPNSGWPSEGWSGMEAYTHTAIPGWKNSLLIGGLKWGRVLRFKLNATGSDVVAIAGSDTLTYFSSTNRYRDIAIAPNGRDLFVIMDKSAATSGPSAANPSIPSCGGCVVKYSFVGYQNSGGKSSIPASIPVTTGAANTCTAATTITINSTNNNMWVPITGPDGNIMAEIKANGNNLGTVASSFYTHTGAVREDVNKRLYLNRSITIMPQTQPATPVSIRLYFTTAEFNALKTAFNSAGAASGVNVISNLGIFKNGDACRAALALPALAIAPVYAEAHGTSGYMLQANISSFSTFYFGSSAYSVLPLELTYFKGALQKQDVLLQWQTAGENNASHFEVERNFDGAGFKKIGSVAATGAGTFYEYADKGAATSAADGVQYRLKMLDKDGRFEYSNSIAISMPQHVDVLVFPNPVREKLTVRMASAAADVRIQVTDVQGRVLHASRKQPVAPVNLEIDVRNWAPQLYIVTVTNSNGDVLATRKFEKGD